MNTPPFRPAGSTWLAVAAVCGSATLTPLARAADPAAASTAAQVRKLEAQNAQLSKSVEAMQQQLQELKQQLLDMKQQTGAIATQQKTQAEQVQQATAAQQKIQADVTAATATANEAAAQSTQQAQQATAQAAKLNEWNKFSLWGYGEVYYTRPTKHTEQTTLDLARGVFGIGYQFDDKTRFNSEYEVEHAVASSDDAGEVEVEQLYIEHKFNDALGMRAGVFLIPAGLLNENHEPTNFYGVQRNFVETLIIPSTWREGGLSLFGSTNAGFDWNVGVTTGVDLSKWDFAPESAPYTSALELIGGDAGPLQATHQEAQFAKAKHLSGYVSLNYRGVPGLTLGGSYFGGGANPAVEGIRQNVSLYEVHGRYQPGRLDVSGVYAQGRISNTGAVNSLFPGTANAMPARFDGWYVQAAYNVWQNQGTRLTPFVRYERYNLGSSYEGIAPGFSPTPTGSVPSSTSPSTFDFFPVPRDRVVTLGANFYLNPNVVFKVDYQKFRTNSDFTRVDLGLGLSF